MAREKFDEIRISAENPEQKETISKYVVDKFLDVGDRKEVLMHELKRNEFEKKSIVEVKLALNRALRKLGLDDVDIPEENIHIYEETDFEKLNPGGNSGGFYTSRHIYMPRTNDKINILRVLSHEMVHLAAFSIRGIKTKLVEDEIEIEMLESKSGLRFSSLIGKGEERRVSHLFMGMNEAVTERTAMIVRRNVAFKELGLSRDDAERILGTIDYAGHVALLNILIMKFNPASTEKATKQIIANAIKGDYSFFKDLESKVKGATKILAEMGTTVEDAAVAADKFGFKDVANNIREGNFNALSYAFEI